MEHFIPRPLKNLAPEQIYPGYYILRSSLLITELKTLAGGSPFEKGSHSASKEFELQDFVALESAEPCAGNSNHGGCFRWQAEGSAAPHRLPTGRFRAQKCKAVTMPVKKRWAGNVAVR